MQPRTLRSLLIGLVALMIVSGAFAGGLLAGWVFPVRPQLAQMFSLPGLAVQTPVPGQPAAPSPSVAPTPPGLAATTEELRALFSPFWEAWQIVHNRFIDQPVDNVALMRGAIRGMLAALGDEHSSYIDPDQLRQFNIPLQGEYDGIGAWVDTTGEFLTIISPMPDSPAGAAGLKAGDAILAVDGEDMTGITGDLVIRKVVGPAGSKVKLTVLRKGVEEPFEVEVTRAKINVPSVAGKMLDGNIGYIRLSSFGETTDKEFRKELSKLLDQKPTGLILDLRYNGGGLLSTSIEIASEFIPKGVILYERYGDGKETVYKAFSGGLATEIPLVVLVNEGSASASEIVAGAIQDYGRGKLVGTTTFGKGSVQDWIELENGEGAVRVTIAHWFTPKERLIDKVGLKPDVEVILTDADVQAQKDSQLEKAIEVLTAAK